MRAGGGHAPIWRGYIFSGSLVFKIRATLPILYLEGVWKQRIRWIETGTRGFDVASRVARPRESAYLMGTRSQSLFAEIALPLIVYRVIGEHWMTASPSPN